MKYTTIALILLFTALHGSTLASESNSEPQKKAEPWDNNRLTSEQPFPARVVAVAGSWVGYQLLLEEVGAESPRYCYVHIAETLPLKYVITTKDESPKLAIWNKIDPNVLVSDFSMEGKLYKLGRKFGAEDLLRSAIARTKQEAEQAAP